MPTASGSSSMGRGSNGISPTSTDPTNPISSLTGASDALLLAQRNSDYLRRKKHQVSRTLDPQGRYCNSLVDDIDYWNPEFLRTENCGHAVCVVQHKFPSFIFE